MAMTPDDAADLGRAAEVSSRCWRPLAPLIPPVPMNGHDRPSQAV